MARTGPRLRNMYHYWRLQAAMEGRICLLRETINSDFLVLHIVRSCYPALPGLVLRIRLGIDA